MKRHTQQNNQQKTGSYFTTNVDNLLSGYNHIVIGKTIIEPFAGGGDISKWCLNNGAISVDEYDIHPLGNVIQNDSILHPPFGEDCVVVTNPPYLSRNKNKDKIYYDKWQQNDLYKCHLASLVANNVNSGILILPSNFLSERNSKAREMFFSKFRMNKVKYYRTPIFSDATTGVVIFDFYRWNSQSVMECDFEIHYSDHIDLCKFSLHSKNKWLVGEEFFDYIGSPIHSYSILREGQTSNSNIVIGLLDKGKYKLGAHYNNGDPLYCSPKAFTTFQCNLSVLLNENEQKKVIEIFNERLNFFRNKYHSLFLANYMGAEQKILSRYYVQCLLSKAIEEATSPQTGTIPLAFRPVSWDTSIVEKGPNHGQHT